MFILYFFIIPQKHFFFFQAFVTPEGFEMAIMLLSVEEETRQRTFLDNPSEKTKVTKDKFEKEKINVIEKTINLIEENKNEKYFLF